MMARQRVWKGICTVCRKDLYGSAERHYSSAAHLERAGAWERRQERERRRAEADALAAQGGTIADL